MTPPRRLIGRLSVLPILMGIICWAVLGGVLAYLQFSPDAPPPRYRGSLFLPLAAAAWGLLTMLSYAANLLFMGGYGVYEQAGKIVHRVPFLTSVRLEDVMGVGLGTNFKFKDAPDYIYLAIKDGRRVKISSLLHKTPFQEMISNLEALGAPRIPGKADQPEPLP